MQRRVRSLPERPVPQGVKSVQGGPCQLVSRGFQSRTDLGGEVPGSSFSHKALAPAQRLGPERRSEIKYGLQLLPSPFPICMSPLRGSGVRERGLVMDCPDPCGDHAGLGEEATANKQTAYSGHSIRRSRLGGGCIRN